MKTSHLAFPLSLDEQIERKISLHHLPSPLALLLFLFLLTHHLISSHPVLPSPSSLLSLPFLLTSRIKPISSSCSTGMYDFSNSISEIHDDSIRSEISVTGVMGNTHPSVREQPRIFVSPRRNVFVSCRDDGYGR